jgi:hypothetical protein
LELRSSNFANRSSMLKSRCSNPFGGGSRRDPGYSGLKCSRSGLANAPRLSKPAPRMESTAPLASKAAPPNGVALRRFQKLLRRFIGRRACFLICCPKAICTELPQKNARNTKKTSLSLLRPLRSFAAKLSTFNHQL